MWPGPYGDRGSRKYLLASLDQSLSRMGLEYVDIFYSHRADPDTPLEETMGALATAVTSGRALYAGISSYSAERTREAAAILRDLGVPVLIHQPSYSLLNRWIEEELLDTLGEEGIGCIAFSPLAQGLLTTKYLNGVPDDSRASRNGSLSRDQITDQTLAHVRALNEIARERGQSLAQMAISWTLRDDRVTSALIGASSVGSSRKISPPRAGRRSPRRSWRRSTGTRSRPGSISGRRRARADRGRQHRRWRSRMPLCPCPVTT